MVDQVQLTPDEEQQAIADGIFKAKKDKLQRQYVKQYSEKIFADRVYPSFTANELRQIATHQFMERYGRPYVLDKDNTEIFESLCQYFTADPAFEKGGLRLNKGLMLFGHVGTGKTEMMKLFMLNQVQSFGMVSCRAITDDFTQAGEEEVERFNTNRKNAVPHKFGQEYSGWCFDDLGTESIPVLHYGNKKNMMADIILNRYDSKMNYRFTHVTTNLTAEQITLSYGSRVLDRMREMFNLITFPSTAKSRR